MSTIEGSNDSDTLPGTADPDLILGFEGADSLSGLDGGDTLDGDTENDTLAGGCGADSLLGEAGDDVLFGENGNDTLIGGCGDDEIVGGNDDDSASGGDGDDTLEGGSGADTMSGGNGGDTLRGEDGPDVLFGNDGDDLLVGGNGNDLIHGGDGSDAVSLAGSGNDTIFAGNDADYILSGVGSSSIDGGDGNDLVFYDGGVPTGGVLVDLELGTASFEGGTDTLASIESVAGTDGSADTILGDLAPNAIGGLGGDDSLAGRGGDDELYAAQGNDTAAGGAGVDDISGDDGDDSLEGGSGSDFVDGGCGHDWILEGLGSDTIDGDEGYDRVVYEDRARSDVTIIVGHGPIDPGSPDQRVVLDIETGDEETDALRGVEEVLFSDGSFTPAPMLLVSNGFLVEGDAGSLLMTFTVSLTTVLETAVIFNAATLGGSATSGVDFTAVAEEVTIPAYETSVDFTVPIVGDLDLEGLETFSVAFANASGASFPGGLTTVTATGFILDNEGGISPTDDYANDTTSGAALVPGTPVRGSIGINGDHDFFRLDLVAGQTYEIALEGRATDQGSLRDPLFTIRDAEGDTIPAGNSIVRDDDDGEGYNSFLSFTPDSSGTYFLDVQSFGNNGTGTYLARLDLPSSLPALTVENLTLYEGTGGGMIARVNIRSSRVTSEDVSVTVTAVASSASSGSDFEPVTGTATIEAGSTFATFDIPIVTDSLIENDETFSVVLSDPQGAILGQNPTGIVQILDDDATHVTISGAAVLEGDAGTGLPPFTIGLSGVTQSSAVVVSYIVSSGTGTAGVDVTGPLTGQVTIPAGQSAASIPVFVAGDTLFEGTETIYARITSISGGDAIDIGSPSGARATILDDDALPPVTVTGITSVGGAGPDVIEGAALVDSLSGAGGDDVILAGRSGDFLGGGAGGDFLIGDLTLDDLASTIGGADQIFGGADSDTVLAGSGNDTVSGEAANDLLVGEAGRDLLSGDDGPDALYGGNDADTLKGGADDDFLFGEAGADVLDGGAANDRIYVDGNDLVADGGDGIFDVVVLTGPGPWEVSLADPFHQNLGGGPQLLGFEAIDAAVAGGPVTITGWSFNDLGNVLYGSAFDDVITGSSAVDIILGGEGNDSISGGAGGDSIGSEAGDDTIAGGLGADVFFYFNTALSGETVITDYQPGFDLIGLLSSTAADGEAALDLASETAEGTVLTFAEGRTLTLIGIALEELSPDDFLIV